LPQESEISALVERAKGYDHQALSKLCELYYRDVYAYVYYRVSNVQDAEDLTEDVFLKMVEGIDACRASGEKSFLAWLFRIANNRVIDHYRRRAVRDHLPLDEQRLPMHSGPEGPVQNKLTRERLQRAIPKLTDDQQQVIVLRFVEGLSHAETAQVLGKSEGAVKALQHRGLASLRRILDR
jgi:RNA polymerase sigma-70 factor (ECF subfamily)